MRVYESGSRFAAVLPWSPRHGFPDRPDSDRDHVREALELFGLGSRILAIPITDYIIARRVYVFPEFLVSTSYTWTIMQQFQLFGADRWHLDIYPLSVSVVNRPNGTVRRVNDLHDLADEWGLQWPSWP
jgi:hypothetical protein